MQALENFDPDTPTPSEGLADYILGLPATKAFREAKHYFRSHPEGSLLGSSDRAVLYLLVRALRPEVVLEIGTFAAGTSELIVQALSANGKGGLLTIDPFGGERVPPILAAWPDRLRERVAFHVFTSMDCFIQLSNTPTTLGLVFIDGNHDYGYALYDLVMSAAKLEPGGVIVMDNAEQPGVFWAAKHFLTLNPGWRVIGDVFADHDPDDPFASMGSSLPVTNSIILLAPDQIQITDVPVSFDSGHFNERNVEGFDLDIGPGSPNGHLHIQAFLRSFPFQVGDGVQSQYLELACVDVEDGCERKFVPLGVPPAEYEFSGANRYRTCEIVLAWTPRSGNDPLCLRDRPRLRKLDAPPAISSVAS